jgi:hypothetical protein
MLLVGRLLKKKKEERSGGRIVIAPSRRHFVEKGEVFSEERPGLEAVLPYFWGWGTRVLRHSVVAEVGIFCSLALPKML